MKLIAYSFAALLLFVASCKTISSAAGTKFKQVTITDPGELFSTYGLADDENAVKAINAIAGLTQAEKDDIYKYSHEENWPDGLATLDERLANKPLTKQYHAFLMTSFTSDGGRAINILKVPVSKNGHMKGKMALDHDIYIIITDLGIKK